MKLALVNPKGLSTLTPPISLGILASILRQNLSTVQTQIFDASTDTDYFQQITAYDPDIVAVTAMTPQIVNAYKFVAEIKQVLPQAKTILGGCHATALPEEASKHFDVIVVGEGENVITPIIQAIARKQKVAPIVYGSFVEDLNLLPRPAYDLLHLEKYMHNLSSFNSELKAPAIGLTTSRGCPYKCPFCHNSKRTTPVRYLSAVNIVKEIQFLNDIYGIRSISFNDDEFLVNKKRLWEFVGLLKTSGLQEQIKWTCAARVTTLTPELAATIKKAGCVRVSFGIESVSEKTLNYYKCGTVTRSDIENALSICHKHKIHVGGSFIFGGPNETLRDMKETLNWIKQQRHNGLTMAAFGVLAPYPGSKVYDLAIEKNLFTPENVDYSRFPNPANPMDIENVYLVDTEINRGEMAMFLKTADKRVWFDNQLCAGKSWVWFTRTGLRFLFMPHRN